MVKRLFLYVMLSLFLALLFVPESDAIPAWTRKYNVDCGTCHYPNPPRLNTVGHEFRRAGYRMKDDFNKDADFSTVNNYVSLRMRPRVVFTAPEVGDNKLDFQLNDITLFYAGPVSSHFSAFAEVEFEDEEDTGLLAQVSGVWGDPDAFWTLRTGSAHVISRVGWGGFDRPSGISTASIQSATLTDGGVPFKINGDQRFIEGTYVRGWNRVIIQVLNGINPAGSGNTGRSFDTDTDKDFSLVYERILDDTVSGFTAYSYFGNYHDGILPDTYKFQRYGFTLAKGFGGGFELQGGYMYANDNLPTVKGDDIKGQGFYIDAEKYFESHNFTLFGRYDWIDGNTDVDDNLRQQFILGVTHNLANPVRLAAEAAWINSQAKDATDFRLTTEIMVNF